MCLSEFREYIFITLTHISQTKNDSSCLSSGNSDLVHSFMIS